MTLIFSTVHHYDIILLIINNDDDNHKDDDNKDDDDDNDDKTTRTIITDFKDYAFDVLRPQGKTSTHLSLEKPALSSCRCLYFRAIPSILKIRLRLTRFMCSFSLLKCYISTGWSIARVYCSGKTS